MKGFLAAHQQKVIHALNEQKNAIETVQNEIVNIRTEMKDREETAELLAEGLNIMIPPELKVSKQIILFYQVKLLFSISFITNQSKTINLYITIQDACRKTYKESQVKWTFGHRIK